MQQPGTQRRVGISAPPSVDPYWGRVRAPQLVWRRGRPRAAEWAVWWRRPASAGGAAAGWVLLAAPCRGLDADGSELVVWQSHPVAGVVQTATDPGGCVRCPAPLLVPAAVAKRVRVPVGPPQRRPSCPLVDVHEAERLSWRDRRHGGVRCRRRRHGMWGGGSVCRRAAASIAWPRRPWRWRTKRLLVKDLALYARARRGAAPPVGAGERQRRRLWRLQPAHICPREPETP
jgi:hypothetical protein